MIPDRDIGRIEGKLDGLQVGIDRILAENAECREDRRRIGSRTSAVENRQYWFSGATAALSFMLAKVGSHYTL